MATFTLSEAIARIPMILDVAAADAQSYMKQYIRDNAKKGYSKGTLANSIEIDRRSESERAVGTDVEYAYYVDQGRREISGKFMSWYDPKFPIAKKKGKNEGWVYTHHVDKMDGIHFIDATKAYLESQHYGL